MTEYLTEQEQIEILKNWVKQYSLVILTGMAVAILTVTGWRYWQQRQINTLSHASAIYDEMLTMRVQNNQAASLIHADKLFSHYPKTTYGQMAALMLAREAINKKNYAAGKKNLNWILDNSSISSLKQISRLRLARVLIDESKPNDSLKTLEKVDDKNFVGLIDEVKGDAYFRMKNHAMARQSYKQALVEIPNAEVIRPLLKMKYDNLAPSS